MTEAQLCHKREAKKRARKAKLNPGKHFRPGRNPVKVINKAEPSSATEPSPDNG